MKVQKISLTNFRSYKEAEFTLGDGVMILGPNGSGKSNLIEAMYLLAIGKSYRADRDDEMIRYGEKYFRVIGQIRPISQMGQMDEVEVEMNNGKKKFEINGVPKRMMDFVGKIRAVMFGPRDMDLVEGSPGTRRRYLDFVLVQSDKEYQRSLVSYEKGLRQRNKILENLREGLASRNQLFFWDKLLIKNGEYITRKRGEYLINLDNSNKSNGAYKTYYDKSVISEARLKQYEQQEVAAGVTLVGPHRDDFEIMMGDRDVAKYGSRGEQRMAVLWLKMAERDFLTREGEVPVLLLDDVFSELDHRHREEVEKIVEDQITREGQVVMTTADEHLLPIHGKWHMIKLM